MSVWPFRRRVRYLPQMEMAECGAASLGMVLEFHGSAQPLVELREACGVSRDGASAAGILAAARRYGLKARGLKLEPASLKDLPLPAILHWEMNHFLVLERVGRRNFELVDPALGRRVVSPQRFSDAFSGVVLAFEPTPDLVRVRRRALSLGRYFRALAQNGWALFYVALCALALELLALLFPATSQVLIDHVIKPERTSWLVPLAAVVTFATLVRFAIEWLRDRVVLSLTSALDLSLSSEFVRHLVALPLSFFQHRSSGDLMQRVDANSQLRRASAQLVMSALDAALLASFAALMLVYEPRLGALALGISASRVLLIRWQNARARQLSQDLFTLTGREYAAAIEPLSAPEVVRALGAESYVCARYHGRMVARRNAETELTLLHGSFDALMAVFDGASQAAVLWFGGSSVVRGELTLGVFAGFLVLQGMIEGPLHALFGAVDQWVFAQAVLTRVDDVLATRPAPSGTRTLPALRGELRLDSVSFRYGPSSPWLFENLSLCIAPGEKVALVGKSGEGKSTLMKLLLGVIEPVSGSVLVDGVDLRTLDRQALARQLGVVLQEPFLLEDTVAENLRLRVPDASDDELEDAARLACVHDVVCALRDGYRSVLGAEGTRLSGGQKQRLALARALVRRPRVLLLDEATSSLDLDTEAALHANLGTLGATRVLVAHRLATVRDADRILVIDGGGVAQAGTFGALCAEPGLFRELAEGLAV